MNTKGKTRGHANATVLTLLASASALALSMCASTDAFAQAKSDKPAASDDSVVVTAIRRSLKSAQQLKKDSDVIVDSVTASDIGALPDRSVTEALARIPGVAIDRFKAGVDPDHFSVEGSGVTVRGLNMTRSEFNGRDSFSANNGRSLSFADVPSELMAGVDVFKNPDASMVEGGIAGTVNLRTRVPFDAKGQQFSISAEDSYGDFAKKWSPTYSALYSNRWHTSIGDVGFLIDAVDSKLSTRSDGTQISNYACRTNVTTNPGNVAVTSPAVSCGGTPGIYYPRGAAFRSQLTDRERKGLAVAAQWKSNDDTMLATLQYLRSEATQAWTEHAMEIATDNVAANGDSWPDYGTTVGVDSSGIFTDGVLTTNSTGWRADQGGGGDKRTPLYGLQSNNIYRNQQQNYLTEDTSLNFKWTPNERWGFKFDLQHVNSTVDVADNTIWGSTYQDATIKLHGDDLPEFSFSMPTNLSQTGTACSGTNCGLYGSGTHTSYADPYNSFWRSAMDHFEQSEGKEDTARFDGEYVLEHNDWAQAIDFGVRWSERDQTTRFSQYNWGALSESWGNGGQVWMDETLTGGGTSASHIADYTFDNFMRGQVTNPVGTQGRLYSNSNINADYPGFVNFAESIAKTWVGASYMTGGCGNSGSGGWVPLDKRCNAVAGTPFTLSEINPVNETNTAAYLMLKYKHDVDGGGRLSGNIGVRYTHTKRESSGYEAFPVNNYSTDAQCAAAVPPASTFCSLTPAVRQQMRDWSNNALTPIKGGADYDYLLPSFNLKYAFNPKVQVRLALTKTVSAPDMGLVRAYYNLSLDTTSAAGVQYINANGKPEGIVTVGNPGLKPTQSTNIDLSAEWYFAPVGSLTFALFDKTLTDVVTNTTVRNTFTNNGATFDVITTTPGNSSEKGKVNGFELAYQQTYDFLPSPFNGFGINANYAHINSHGVSQSTLSNTDPDVAAGRVANIDTSKLPLQGLSKDNANLTVFYEKYGVSARLAYNYRSDFLVTVRDVIVPYQPIMQAGGGQLDGSIFYDLTPRVKIGIQGANLNNEVTRTKAILDLKANGQPIEAGRSWFMSDRRITFIVRATY